jgi:hypothetical protein
MSDEQNKNELVVTVFKLLGRQIPKNPDKIAGDFRYDLKIQPMMVREANDEQTKRI